MKPRELFLTGVFILSFFGFNPFSNAEPFKGKGEANFYRRDPVGARGRAIELALKNSVKETILTFVSDWILVLNHKLVDDEIFSNYMTYIKRYEIVYEELGEDGATYRVTVTADIDSKTVEKSLDDLGLLRGCL